jgi:hypothetical protein
VEAGVGCHLGGVVMAFRYGRKALRRHWAGRWGSATAGKWPPRSCSAHFTTMKHRSPSGRSGRDVNRETTVHDSASDSASFAGPATSEGNQAPTTRDRASAEPTTRS